jgi:putative redox protein
MRRRFGECAAMSLIASARSVAGTSRQEVLIDGRHHLTTDEPRHLGGTDLGPAPHELLPAALAACISLTLVTYARTKKWDIGDVDVSVVYDNKSVPRRFDVSIGLGGDLDDEQWTRLTKVAAACPLRRSLEAGFEFHEELTRREPVASHDSANGCGIADEPPAVHANIRAWPPRARPTACGHSLRPVSRSTPSSRSTASSSASSKPPAA